MRRGFRHRYLDSLQWAVLIKMHKESGGLRNPTQTSLDKHVASTFQQVMSLNPTSREANLPPLNPSTKRPQASVTPLSGTPNPSVRSSAQKKACPEKHGNEEAMDKLTKQVGLSITAFEKKPTNRL